MAFWLATLLFATPFLIYPAGLFLFSRLCRQKTVATAKPRATLIISAHNEEAVIDEKIRNALSLEYPTDLLEVMVISDASEDRTDEIVAKYADRNVKLRRQDDRQGKSAGLSRFCPDATGDILVFTDANSMFRPDALANLLRHFDDENIGYSVGRQLYQHTDQGASASSENLYWSIELRIKEWESRLSSVVGADGAIYALRKELFETLAPEDINDFLLPLKVVVKGYRGIFDPEAVCFEDAAPSFRGEFRRKYRIVNRSLRAVTKVPQALNPFRVGWFAVLLICHKVLRWFGPVFLLAMLVTSAFLSWREFTENGAGLYTVMLGLQLAGYGLAGLHLLPPMRKFRIVYVAWYFLLINFSAAVGIGLLLSGHTIGVWKPQR